jgi:co-chaperonin GroES (HSP10)
MKVLNKFLLVKREQENNMSTTGFMYGADDMRELRYQKATVVSFGQNVMGLEENSEILFDKVAGHDVLIENERLTVIQEKDVVCILR